MSVELSDDDKRALDVGTKLFGENRGLVYRQLVDSGINPTLYLNKLDTLAQHSSYPNLITSGPLFSLLNSDPKRHHPNGAFRAMHYQKPGVYVLDSGKSVDIPGNTVFMQVSPNRDFLYDYMSELAHSFNNKNDVPEFMHDPFLLIGRNARRELPAGSVNTVGYNNPIYNEWKTHSMTQKLMHDYLTDSNLTYQDYIRILKQEAFKNREPGAPFQNRPHLWEQDLFNSVHFHR